ncbi:MAG TPA: helix-turn-helix domain-containing protein [Pyrinomonadaceae bacterium]|nr:helix-turn-helix domain-containing protein [Pyrinomonadaceae bacterium]
MNYQESRPTSDLCQIVKCYWALEYDKQHGSQPELVLPDGCPEIVFNLSDRFLRVHSDSEERQPGTLFAGQMSRSIMLRPSGSVKLFGVRLQPAGASSLVNFPVSEITDAIVGFDDACGREGRELEERLNLATTFEERIWIFEAWVRTKRSQTVNRDQLASEASLLIAEGRGSHSISTIANRIGVSERRLERHFKHRIGISPKTFSRIVRFQAVVRSVQNDMTVDVLETALDLGYYDQSHLIRDFREFSGITPQAFFERTHQISDIFTGAA